MEGGRWRVEGRGGGGGGVDPSKLINFESLNRAKSCRAATFNTFNLIESAGRRRRVGVGGR